MNENELQLELKKLEAETELKKTALVNRYQILITILGTTIVSIVASYFVFAEKSEKHAYDFDGGHRAFVAQFVDIAIDKDIERRQRLARYFASVTLDSNQKSRWEEYASYVEGLISDNPTKIAQLTEKLKSANAQERSALESRIRFLEKQLSESTERANIQLRSSEECILKNANFPGRWHCIAMKELNLGVKEIPGPESNIRILDYAKYAGKSELPWMFYDNDDIPWMSLFVAWVITQSGIHDLNLYVGESWLKFGVTLSEPIKGALTILKRPSDIRKDYVVGFYDGEDDERIYIIGGNIQNAVKKGAYKKEWLVAYKTVDKKNYK